MVKKCTLCFWGRLYDTKQDTTSRYQHPCLILYFSVAQPKNCHGRAGQLSGHRRWHAVPQGHTSFCVFMISHRWEKMNLNISSNEHDCNLLSPKFCTVLSVLFVALVPQGYCFGTLFSECWDNFCGAWLPWHQDGSEMAHVRIMHEINTLPEGTLFTFVFSCGEVRCCHCYFVDCWQIWRGFLQQHKFFFSWAQLILLSFPLFSNILSQTSLKMLK